MWVSGECMNEMRVQGMHVVSGECMNEMRVQGMHVGLRRMYE